MSYQGPRFSLSRRNHRLLITTLAPILNAIILIPIITHQFSFVNAIDGAEGVIPSARNVKQSGVGSSSTISSRQNEYYEHGSSYTKYRAPAECTQEPRFSILTSESLLRSANVSYDEKKAEIWTFGRIYLVLECRASSPIDFNFDGQLVSIHA